MTKINQLTENAAIQATKKSTTVKSAQFQASLQNAMEKTTGTDLKSRQTSTLSEPQSVHFTSGKTPSMEVINKTDTLLNLLESYVTSLENPNTTLKELAPLVTRMKDDAQQLLVAADKHPSAGTDIIGIATQTALTAEVEYMKFQRGDFI